MDGYVVMAVEATLRFNNTCMTSVAQAITLALLLFSPVVFGAAQVGGCGSYRPQAALLISLPNDSFRLEAGIEIFRLQSLKMA